MIALKPIQNPVQADAPSCGCLQNDTHTHTHTHTNARLDSSNVRIHEYKYVCLSVSGLLKIKD